MPLLAPAPVSVVQQVSGTSTFDYGWLTVALNSTGGNALVVLAGWDLSTQPTNAAMAAVYVTDSAGNVWTHCGTSAASVTGSRCCAWVCLNARPVSWVTVSATTFVSSLATTVIEVAGLPDYVSIDVAAANASPSASTLALTPGNASVPDIGFSVLATGATGLAPATPGGWTALATVTAGAGAANPVEIFPYWDTSVPGGATVNTSWTVGRAVPLSAVSFALKAEADPPPQLNANFPVLKIEAGFGFTPGDPSQGPPEWTDITARCIAKTGSALVTSSMGRQYELAQAEAGELHVWLDNHDGAVTPGNTSSPFYPNVVLGTPLRVTALWDTQWYHIGFGWVERWPQTWPDLPQWGLSEVIATDVFSVMASANMTSALLGDILIDAPYVLLPCAEQYTTLVGGLNPTFVAADSQGLLAANASRVNQRAGFYVDGTGGVIADTGQSTSMLGTSDSGFGTGSISAAPAAGASGPGVIYTDPNLPDPDGTNGVTAEFYVTIPTNAISASVQPVVFSAYGPAGNYTVSGPSLQVKINNFTGGNTLTVTLADGSTVSAPFSATPTSATNPGQTQQIVLALTASSLSIYVNGGLATTAPLTAAQTTAWQAVSLGCPNYAYQSENLTAGNFTASTLAVYPYQLAPQRITSHYETAIAGQQNVDATARIAQILSWANLGIARAGQVLFGASPGTEVGVLQGPAYGLSGQSAATAVNQVVTNETAQAFGAPSGAVVFAHKWALFNQAPAVVFGDSNNVPDGEVPYLQATSWDYDNAFLYNVVQVTQQTGPNNTVTVTDADFGSQASYFTRAPQTQTIQTMSNLDAYSQAAWLAAKYAQPSLRVANIVVDAASNSAVAFPAVLGLQQGQIATVTRRPVGGAVISQNVIVQKIDHSIGPSGWKTGYQLAPYSPEDAVLQLDRPGFNVVGNNTLA